MSSISPAPRPDIGRLRVWFEEQLEAWLPAPEDPGEAPLLEAMHYACQHGKRVRPLLCLGAAAACGAGFDCALAPALAVEFVHCYSLAHDDLPALDNDTERRGRPTVHVRHGEAQAILAGDALLTAGFAVLAAKPAAADPAGCHGAAGARRLTMIGELARASGHRGMVGGQARELALAGTAAGLDQANQVVRLKTGALIEVSCRLGALAAGAPPALLTALTEFGRHYGFAYQLADDLGDAQQDAVLARGLNLATILGADEARRTAALALRRAEDIVAGTAWPGDPAYLGQLCAIPAVVL